MRRYALLPTVLLFLLAHSLPAAVISEIHYNAPAGGERLEFIEISNDTSTPEDLSGWEFIEGIQYVFPPATILRARSVIVVCKDVEAIRSHYGIDNALGNYTGNLAGSGEQVTLVNQVGVVIQSVSYDDEGKWPVGPDGSGHTLSLAHVHLDPSEPESWRQSVQLGGTPGFPNFPLVDPFDRAPLLDSGALWRYREGRGPFSDGQDWREPDFDDAHWSEGATPIGTGYGDEATTLADMPGSYTTVACRVRLELDEADLHGPRDLFLAIEFDAGFCAWLNGEEVARDGCAEGADWDSTATDARPRPADPATPEELLFPLPLHLLRRGDNVISILGLSDALEADRFRLRPRVVRLGRPAEAAAPGPGLVFNELFRGEPQGNSGWVEIYNAGSWVVDLSGHHLTDDADRIGAGSPFTFPAGTSIAPGDFLLVNESDTVIDFSQDELRLLLVRPDRIVLGAHVFGRSVPAEVAPGTYSEARFPDGGRPGWLTLSPTPSTPNDVARQEDLVINEILYHPPEEGAGDSPDNQRSEFLELYNRGGVAIDLDGFRFTRGIDYTFEDVSIGPGEYLVLAQDPAIVAEHHGYDGALGPYVGVLANDGENIRLVDRLGNLVDEVRYHEGGEWSLWADGRGASLELLDPNADNDFGAAWEASDESETAAWEELSYTVPAHAPSEPESEFHLFLVEKGICRIDDVSITRAGGENLIPNPGFEAGTVPWLIQGTHVHSRLVTTDSHSGNACLEVVASGKGNSRVNRIEVDTDPRLTPGPYEVSLWARWQRGASLLITHSDFTAGPFPFPGQQNLSSNTLGERLRMTVPYDLGTPGTENSVRRDNLGPVIGDVLHRPAVPVDSEPIGVTARVSDPDGVAEVRALFRLDKLSEDFQSRPLFDDGYHGDGAAGDGLYRGELPGFQAGSTVVFYVEASDTLGNVLRSPRTAPDRTRVLVVDTAVETERDCTRIVLDSARFAELSGRPLHSNDLVDAAFVLNESEVFYNTGVRYRGSPWGRAAQQFRVRFARDELFPRGHKELNVASRAFTESMSYFIIGRVGTRQHRAPAPDYLYVDGRLNHASLGLHAAFEPVNRGYLTRWLGEETDGPVLKADGRMNFSDGGALEDVQFASLTYMGEDSESYRMYWLHGLRQTEDDWQPFMDFCKFMEQSSTQEFDSRIDEVLDVESFVRVLGARILMADGDALFITGGHNGYMVRNSRTGIWSLVPFDVDTGFGFSGNLFRLAEPSIERLFGRPAIRRTYYRILEDFVEGYWSAERAGPWLDALEETFDIRVQNTKIALTLGSDFVREELQKVDKPFSVFAPGSFLVEVGDTWAFQKGTGPFSDPPAAWREPEFDDAGWTTGPSPFGFGDVTSGTVLSDMQNSYTTLALRKRFEVTEERIDDDYFFLVAYDDGFCAWLNGQEIARANCGAPGEDVAWNATATDVAEVGTSETRIPIPPETLLVGENVLAIIGLNVTIRNNDFGVVPRVLRRPRTVVTPTTTARLLGEAPVRVTTLEVSTGGGPSRPFTPTWTSEVTWQADFELDRAATTLEITGFDSLGQLVDAARIEVISTAGSTFQRGEVTGDGTVNLTDALAILEFLSQHGPMDCLDAADADDDGRVTILDAIRLIFYLFAGGQEPAPPFATPGEDPTADALDCARS